MSADFAPFLAQVATRAEAVRAYLFESARIPRYQHPHLNDALLSYPLAGGKALRAAVLMFSCGAVGGEESLAIPAAAAVEVYHVWTLVHDDIIDRDELRRGQPTVHIATADRAKAEWGYSEADAAHYGLSMAILTGDVQQGWSMNLLQNLWRENGLSPELVMKLLHQLFYVVQNGLVDGEALDILYERMPIEELSAEQILEMQWKKTGILYEFAGRAGAAIGLGQMEHEFVEKVAQYTGRCGIAFQIQDDLLGLVGDSAKMGKPVGADIREGKRTLMLLHALPRFSAAARQKAFGVIGNPQATPAQIQEVIQMMAEVGSLDYARDLARQQVAEALEGLHILPESPSKTWLATWGHYLVAREL